MKQNPVKIYKAAFREGTTSDVFRSIPVFNFGLTNESQEAFGNLKILNDETLAPYNSVSITAEETSDILILPLVGALDYKDSLGNTAFLITEQIRIFSAYEGMSFELFNPYEKDLVNYLQIRIANNQEDFTVKSLTKSFDFSKRNELIPIFENNHVSCSIGVYDGRKEGIYHLKDNKKGVATFIINGAFEFENRLIETKDALALWETDSVEFEALSENAILLVLEF